MEHLTEKELSALLDGALRGDALWRADQHVQSCEACRDALAELSTQDATLGAALSNEPGEAYFATFADRVVGRIASIEASGEPEGRAEALADRAPLFTPWWRRPQALTAAGSALALVAAAGIVFLTARDMPLSREGKVAERATQQSLPSPVAESDAPRDQETTAESKQKEEATKAGGDSRANLAPMPSAQPVSPPSAPAPAVARERSGTRMGEVARGAAENERRAVPARPFASEPGVAARQELSTTDKLRQAKRATLSGAQKSADDLAKEQAQRGAPVELPKSLAADAAPQASSALRRDEGGSANAFVNHCGVVRDDSGRPLPGVAVTTVGATRSSTTGADGRFCIELPPGEHMLQVMAVGFKSERINVPAGAAREPLIVALSPVAVLGGGRTTAFRDNRAAAPSAPSTGAAAPQRTSTALSSLSGGEAALRAVPAAVRPAAEAAVRAQSAAASAEGAEGYDQAAAAWERLLPRVAGTSSEAEIRARIADCRYFAWRKSRDERHASLAISALTSFIGRVPIGDRQTLAARWLDQIKGR